MMSLELQSRSNVALPRQFWFQMVIDGHLLVRRSLMKQTQYSTLIENHIFLRPSCGFQG